MLIFCIQFLTPLLDVTFNQIILLKTVFTSTTFITAFTTFTNAGFKCQMKINKTIEDFESLGDDHIGTSSNTPMRNDAFTLSSDEKIDIIKDDVRHILETLGLDLNDDSLKGTPNRVAKMFVKENSVFC